MSGHWFKYIIFYGMDQSPVWKPTAQRDSPSKKELTQYSLSVRRALGCLFRAGTVEYLVLDTTHLFLIVIDLRAIFC